MRIERLGYDVVDLDSDEFAAAKNAKAFLLEMLAGEERLNIVLENYAEYEEDLLRMTLHATLFEDASWNDFKGRIHRVDRRLLNVLSAARLYLDHSRHSISSLYGSGSSEMTELERQTSAEYDAHLGYRVMEALRNYVQHRGLGVHHLALQSWRVGVGDDERRRHTLSPSVRPRTLQEVGGFKQSVLTELESLGELVDLRPLVRQYIAGIARVQLLIRTVTAERTKSAEERYSELMQRFHEPTDSELPTVIAQERQANDRLQQSRRLD